MFLVKLENVEIPFVRVCLPNTPSLFTHCVQMLHDDTSFYLVRCLFCLNDCIAHCLPCTVYDDTLFFLCPWFMHFALSNTKKILLH